LGIHLRLDMAVDVKRDARRRVTEPLAHDFGVDAGLKGERGPSVTEIVEADGAHPGPLRRRCEGAREADRVELPAGLVAEHEVVVNPCLSEREPFLALS